VTVSVVGDVLIVLGAVWFVLAGLGVARLGDALARVHAATKATTLGMILVVLGAALHLPVEDGLRIALAIFLIALTNPLGGHLLGRAVEANPGTAEVRIDVRATLDDDGTDEGDEPEPA
jgi:multicomponent Na+:H+ antiporter subunit G